MNITQCALLVLFSPLCLANNLPSLADPAKASPHKLYLSSHDASFDEWSIEGGYSYEVIQSLDLYVGARMNHHDRSQNSVLSGVSYQWSDRWVISSALRTYKYDETVTGEKKDANVAAEVSSRFKVTENLDVHATLDYQEFQQEVAVGIGFRF